MYAADFLPLECGGAEYLSAAWRLIEESIPKNERRSWEQQQRLSNDSRYNFQPLLHGGNLVAVLCTWHFPELLFIEHIVVHPLYRGSGFGSKIISVITQKCDHRIVLETELPHVSAGASTRIAWYKRMNFEAAPFEYVQPPYCSNKASVPMILMASPGLSTREAFNGVVRLLQQEVYKIPPLS